ncbi:MAG: ring-cleaving dioxygenase, partial [Gemmatimonadales bacterium]
MGIHHITAIAGEPQRNLDFYAGILPLAARPPGTAGNRSGRHR